MMKNTFISFYEHWAYRHCTVYKTNEWVYPDRFDEDVDNVCSYGIHYFQSLEAAFCYCDLYLVPDRFYANGHASGDATDWIQLFDIPLNAKGDMLPTRT
jgi:hypothetical protein